MRASSSRPKPRSLCPNPADCNPAGSPLSASSGTVRAAHQDHREGKRMTRARALLAAAVTVVSLAAPVAGVALAAPAGAAEPSAAIGLDAGSDLLAVQATDTEPGHLV